MTPTRRLLIKIRPFASPPGHALCATGHPQKFSNIIALPWDLSHFFFSNRRAPPPAPAESLRAAQPTLVRFKEGILHVHRGPVRHQSQVVAHEPLQRRAWPRPPAGARVG